jgi:hypothetical protein
MVKLILKEWTRHQLHMKQKRGRKIDTASERLRMICECEA